MATFFNDLPPEIAAQYEEIERKKKVQNALMAQTLQQPQTQMGRSGKYQRAVPYSPLEGATKLIQAAMLSKASDKSNRAMKDLGRKYNQGYQGEFSNVVDQLTGRPERPAEYVPAQMGTGPIVPAVKPDPSGAAMAAAGSADPRMQRVAESMLSMQKNASARGAYSRPIEYVGGDGKPRWGWADTRNEQLNPMTLNQSPVMGVPQGAQVTPPKYHPPTTQAIAGAKKTGESEAVRTFNMSGIGQVISRARDLMNGIDSQSGEITGDTPTQSMVGAAYDWLGSVFGYSPEGAKEATALEAIGGALTAKMPRMEGPQSDKDTLLYRQMAAQIGNKMKPLDQRKFALEEVQRIWAKYEHLNQDATGGSEGLPSGFVLD